MKLNCDLGEGESIQQVANDALIMPFIDQANIACGMHASNPSVMLHTVQLAKTYNVSIGAHPSYDDKTNFGRQNIFLSSEEIISLLLYQLGALQAICLSQDAKLDYVKPHGALYNNMMAHPEVLEAVLQAMKIWNQQKSQKQRLPVMVLANQQAEQISKQAESFGVPLLFEAFADRSYNDDGSLVARNIPGAVLESESEILAQASLLFEQAQIRTMQGKNLSLNADSLCVHGDNPQAFAAVQAIRQLVANLDKD